MRSFPMVLACLALCGQAYRYSPSSLGPRVRSRVSNRLSHPFMSEPQQRQSSKEAFEDVSMSSRTGAVDMQVTLQQDETPEAVKLASEVFMTFLRLGTCALMIHHGLDKIQNLDGFSANVVAKFFGFLPGPSQLWTLSAALTQVVGAILLAVGVFSRPVALSMTTTMIVAVIFHLLNTGPEAFPLGVPKAHSYNFELASMYVLVLSYFSVNGAGKFSVDEQILGGEFKFYEKQLKKLMGNQD